MEQPDEVHLSRQDGEALLKRLQGDALTAQDRHVLEQVLQWYFWLLFALQEARFSLKRLRRDGVWRQGQEAPATALLRGRLCQWRWCRGAGDTSGGGPGGAV